MFVPRPVSRALLFLLCLPLAVVLMLPAAAAAQQAPGPAWMRGLEEIMSVPVTSVSKKAQRLEDTSASVYVLTRDDIRRSGMRTLPDLLRLVPGLHVAQIDGSKWAVSARGMNSRWSNKLLVMIDGRSIYSPYFAGVFWEAIDVPVQAIDHVEVVRGPGASVWGANAVNGVINIITTGAAVQRDTAVSVGGGGESFGSLLHEGRVGDRFGYRMFADASSHPQLSLSSGSDAGDPWSQRRAGGSFHATLNARDSLDVTLQGTNSVAHWVYPFVEQMVPFTTVTKSAKVDEHSWSTTGQWTRQLTGHGQLQVQANVDQWWREDESMLDHHRTTVDLGLQHRIGGLGRHDVIWGVGYRRVDETTEGFTTFWLDPAHYNHHLASLFGQDEIAFARGRGHVTVGAKVEQRDYAGWNAQPTARVHWRFSTSHSAWAAVSRAMRAPDRIERSMRLNLFGFSVPNSLPMVVALVGNPRAKAEWATSYEAGYRALFGSHVSLDLAGYVSRYSDLEGFETLAPQLQFDNARPYLLLPSAYRNALDATTAGGEAEVNYTPVPRLKLTGGYTLFSITPRFHPGMNTSGFDEGGAPRHEGQLRSLVSLGHGVELSAALIGVGPIPALQVDGYARLDTRIAWRPRQAVELGLVGQNLTNASHREFAGAGTGVIETSRIRRAGYAELTWHF